MKYFWTKTQFIHRRRVPPPQKRSRKSQLCVPGWMHPCREVSFRGTWPDSRASRSALPCPCPSVGLGLDTTEGSSSALALTTARGPCGTLEHAIRYASHSHTWQRGVSSGAGPSGAVSVQGTWIPTLVKKNLKYLNNLLYWSHIEMTTFRTCLVKLKVLFKWFHLFLLLC